MAGSIRDNSFSDLNIIFRVNGVTFTHTNMSAFTILNTINAAPQGQFNLLDDTNSITTEESGLEAELIFTNTSVDNQSSESRLVITIDDVFDISPANGNNTTYTIIWTAGSANMLDHKTKAFTGTSVNAMYQVLKYFNVPDSIFPYPDNAVKLTDTMTWRLISDDMWGMLNNIVKNSHINDDYIYWCWDDITNSYKISSFGISKSQDDRYIIAHDENSVSSAVNSKIIFNNPEFVLWRFDTVNKRNRVGKNRAQLKPNVSFSVNEGTKLVDGKFGDACFNKTVTSMEPNRTDVTKSTIATVNGKSGFSENGTYAPLEVKRHYKNNVHNLYAFGKTYREYKYATYAKEIAVALYNTMGPPLGSKVTVIVPSKDYKTSGHVLDLRYSDSYIVVAKQIDYATVDLDKMGRERPSANNVVTKLVLVSDNFNGDGTEHLSELANRLQGVV